MENQSDLENTSLQQGPGDHKIPDARIEEEERLHELIHRQQTVSRER